MKTFHTFSSSGESMSIVVRCLKNVHRGIGYLPVSGEQCEWSLPILALILNIYQKWIHLRYFLMQSLNESVALKCDS